MIGDRAPAPTCDEYHCITCGDDGDPMTVVQVDADRGLALCADGGGARHTIETALVEPVAPGDRILVHAGTAIAALAPQDLTTDGGTDAPAARDLTTGDGTDAPAARDLTKGGGTDAPAADESEAAAQESQTPAATNRARAPKILRRPL